MTPDQQLQRSIMSDGSAATKPSNVPNPRDAKRTERRNRAARFGWKLRLGIMLVSLSASAAMIFTEQGRAARAEFQTAILDVIKTELEARRPQQAVAAAPDAGGDPEPAPSGPTWIKTDTGAADTRPKVSAMPESRVTVRRLGQDG
ncbi:hypothetical protein [Sagittula sp. SSi028]|uniref:hypothetical protein n=1 Tax=Sagittula sp. SSi028 TaxID=3400636 RepID=UPI003AF5842D